MIRNILKWVILQVSVRKNVTIGKNLHVGLGSILWAPQKLTVGDEVYIGKNTTIQVDGTIGDHVLIANSVGIVGRSDHDIHTVGTPLRSANWVGDNAEQQSHPVNIGSDVWIGYGAIILSGVTVGDSSVIAAGALVTNDIPANSIAAGAPAKVLKNRFSNADFQSHWNALSRHGVRRHEGSEQ